MSRQTTPTALARLIMAGLVMLALGSTARAQLMDYINNGDKTFEYKINQKRPASETATYSVINATLTSQTWRGNLWKHTLTIFIPKEITQPDTAMLLITGGSNKPDGEPVVNPSPESLIVAQIAGKVKSVCAILSQVPNEPILNGLSEDAAIAHTFDQFLKTREKDWPLLFPMTKSAVRAIDAVQEIIKKESNTELKKFFVTGASKRGWTTWLAGVADPRIIAIAPMVIDNLNMSLQMPHQMAQWGKYSEMINDYVALNLPQRSSDPEVVKLMMSVDPYAYRDNLKLPKLMVNGTNDPYWVLDANRFYFNELKGERYLHYVPNAGHGLGAGAAEAIAGYYWLVKNNEARPKIAWEGKAANGKVDFNVTVDKAPKEVRLWKASTLNDKDFRDEQWAPTPIQPEADGSYKAAIDLPQQGLTAYYAELLYEAPTKELYGFCTALKVIGGTEDPNSKSSTFGE